MRLTSISSPHLFRGFFTRGAYNLVRDVGQVKPETGRASKNAEKVVVTLHHGLYLSFVFVYTVLAGVSTQHAADSPPVRFGAAFSMLSE